MTAGQPQAPDPGAVQSALAEADRITREQTAAADLANWHARGEFERGYQQCLADQRGEAEETARRLAADHDLMERRWGKGGREHFADPRPGDFEGAEPNAVAFRRPGRRPPVHQPQRQPETEREAG